MVAPLTSITEAYIRNGMRLDRHIDGFVDAYYGPPLIAESQAREETLPPSSILAAIREQIARLDAGEPVDAGEDSASRRAWLRAQLVGMQTSAAKLAGESIAYADEVQLCYGIRPRTIPTETILDAQERLKDALPGSGGVRERLSAWRESFVVPPERLDAAIHALAEVFRERTGELFGLPQGETVAFELVTNKPWGGFNYYLGELRSRVAINVDLPVLAQSLGHLISHEAYPGHHTEHARKEVGLFRKRRLLEESIFLVGTPQCLMAEGLADFGGEALYGSGLHRVCREVLRGEGITYPGEELEVIAAAMEDVDFARANAAWRLHEDGMEVGRVVDLMVIELATTQQRAEKAVEFLLDPTWRSYITCYVEGYRLVRGYVNRGQLMDRSSRFERLITEPVLPADLLV